MAHPLLGDPAALLKLQDLRQGQGIVDLVNGYLDVLLGSGCLGLSLLFAFIGVLLYRLRAASRRLGAQLRFRTLGASLGACVLATLLLLQDGSFTGAIVPMFFALGALAAAYRTAAEASRVPRSTRVPSKPAAAPLVRPRPARVVGRA
jgi:O-antigen ligase